MGGLLARRCSLTSSTVSAPAWLCFDLWGARSEARGARPKLVLKLGELRPRDWPAPRCSAKPMGLLARRCSLTSSTVSAPAWLCFDLWGARSEARGARPKLVLKLGELRPRDWPAPCRSAKPMGL